MPRLPPCSRDMERDVLMTGRGWGFCAMRSPLAVCRRRVGGLDGVNPPVGGGEVVAAGLVVSRNFARNSLEGALSREERLLELQRFLACLKNDRWKLRAKFVWWGVLVARVWSCRLGIPASGPTLGKAHASGPRPR